VPKEEKEYRAMTKGRFNEVTINTPATNFSRDKRWLLKANP
jgi:hypothetical protein